MELKSNRTIKLFLIFLLFSIILSISSFIIGKFFFQNSTEDIALYSAVEKVNEQEKIVKDFLFKSEQTLESLKELKLFKTYLLTGKNQDLLEDIFLSYTKSQTKIMQLRYIDRNGFEKIRIDRAQSHSQAFSIKENKLQNKKNRYYFKDSKTKDLEKVWFSALDLNKENGKIELPYKPTLRAILPINHNNKFNGILIINYLMDDFLTKLTNLPFYDMIIFDNKGFIINHYKKDLNWGFYKKHPYNISNDFPKNYKQILNTPLLKANHFVSKKLDVPILNGVNLLLQMKKSYLLKQKEQELYQTLLNTLIIFLLSLIISLFVIRIFEKTLLDVKQLNKLNKKITQQKDEFESIFKNSKDGIAILDLESKFLNSNEAYQDMLGFTKDELLQTSCVELSVPEDQEKSEKALNTILEVGFIKNYEKICLGKDQQRITVNMTASLLPDKKRILIITKNITDQKIMEKQSKLAAMGEMIGNIAHQWRQPLSVISTSATGLKIQQECGILDSNKLISSCDSINDNAQYLSQTIDDFRNFLKGDIDYVSVSILDVIHGSLNIVNSSIKDNFIILDLDIQNNINILASKNELEQVIINILNNSKDVLVEKVSGDERYISMKTKTIDKNTLELIIYDNGGGIKEEIITKIFDPYFTTKHQSNGTGLGLSMVDKIIRERYEQTINVHNKHFEYKNKEYTGACFTIIFKN